MPCIVCGKDKMESLLVPEMHYGTRDVYTYKLCCSCETLQLETVPAPEVLAKLYPSESYWKDPETLPIETKVLQRAMFFCLGSLATNSISFRKMVSSLRPATLCNALAYGIKPSDRVLDVGCGSGRFVLGLGYLGVADAQGVDPFISREVVFDNGARISRGYPSDFEASSFDVVTYNHSLEHMPDPVAALREGAAVLKPGGRCVVRVPTTDSYAFRLYKDLWSQLDAPRHVVIPSRAAMRIVGEKAGLELECAIDDSTEQQFLQSELYRKGISFRDASGNIRDHASYFSKTELASFSRKARELNIAGQGDQAIFSFRKRGERSQVLQ